MIFEAAGAVGVDPSPFTLRELLWMLAGKARTLGGESKMFGGAEKPKQVISMDQFIAIQKSLLGRT